METQKILSQSKELRRKYDALHRPGAWLKLKDELGLGTGPFNDRLTTTEIQELNDAMLERLAD